MKSTYLCIMLSLLSLVWVPGCASIKVGDAEYFRWGSQELGNVYAEVDPNGAGRIWIGQQKSEFQLGVEYAGAGVTIGGGK